MSHPTSLLGKVVYDQCWSFADVLELESYMIWWSHAKGTPGLWARSHFRAKHGKTQPLRRCGAKRCECSRGHYQDQAKLVEENTFFFLWPIGAIWCNDMYEEWTFRLIKVHTIEANGWWLQVVFIFTPSEDPTWLISFKGVETTNQVWKPFFYFTFLLWVGHVHSWISMGIIILSREWREIKGVQKPCGVVASSVFSPRKETHFPRPFILGGIHSSKFILCVYIPESSKGVKFEPKNRPRGYNLTPLEGLGIYIYIIYIYIYVYLFSWCAAYPFQCAKQKTIRRTTLTIQNPSKPRYDPIRGLVSYGLQMWHQLSATYGGTRWWFGQGHASLLYDFQLHRSLEGNYTRNSHNISYQQKNSWGN